MSRIARPAFNGSPTDSLQAVDVYGEVSDSVRNKFTTQFSAFGQSLQESLGRVQNQLIGVGNQLNAGTVDYATATQRVKSILRGARGDLDTIGDDLKDSILEGVGIDPTKAKQLKVNLESGVQRIRDADLNNAQGVMALLRDVTGNDVFSVLDLDAEVGVLRGVLEEVSAWGVPELVDSVLSEIDDPEVRRQVVQASTDRLSQDSDIDGIEAILNQVDASALTANRPDFPKKVLERYKFTSGVTPDQYPDKLAQLVGVMDKLHPDWFWTRRGGEDVWNLSIIRTASDDAKQLFYSDPDYRTPALIAPLYPEKEFTALARKLYPGIAF